MKNMPTFRQSLLVLSIFSLINTLFAKDYPLLPEGIANGGGAMIGNDVYIGLGSAKTHFYTINLANPDKQWQRIPDFPAGSRDQPVVVSMRGKLYVFGGLQKDKQGVLQIINDVHSYDPVSKQWKKLLTRSPFSTIGSGVFSYGDKVYFLGGVNLSIFNGYFQDYQAAKDEERKKAIMTDYFNQPFEDYFFNQQAFSYSPQTNQWHNEGVLPFSSRAGAAVAWHDKQLIVANGEVKPGLRTTAVEVGEFDKNDKLVWQSTTPLIANSDEFRQEGLAGAYSGQTGRYYLLAGGANFIGARERYEAGQYFAHKDLKKTYHDSIFTLVDGQWKTVGKLPVPAGYGVSLNYQNSLLIIGGKNHTGTLKSINQLIYDGKKLTIHK